MAELAEGVYVIINRNSQKALDVKGGLDASGTNVQIWTRNDSDSQIFYVSKPEGGNKYEINCSLSIRPLSAIQNSKTKVYNVVQVNNTNDKSTQRWYINDTGLTWQYGTVSYHTYTINWANNNQIGLDVEYYGTADGSNVALHNVAQHTANQQWIFRPMDVLKGGGYYKIAHAVDNGPVLSVSNSSTSNGAQVLLEANNDNANNQVFLAHKDPATSLFYFSASHSDCWIGIWDSENKGAAIFDNSGKPYVNQTTSKELKSHVLWLPIRVPGASFNSYPVYELRSALSTDKDLSLYKTPSDRRAYVIGRTGSGNFGNANQHFLLIPAEGYDKHLNNPGFISPTSFVLDNGVNITVSGLSFTDEYFSKYQARYRVISYYANGTESSHTAWRNVFNNSSGRSGWGDAMSETPVAKSGDVVTFKMLDPEDEDRDTVIPFSKTYTLNTSNSVSKALEIEVRGFVSEGTMIKHGPSTLSRIMLTQRPTVTTLSNDISQKNNQLFFNVTLQNTPAIGVTSVRARLLDANRNPISDYTTSSTLTVSHNFDDLYRLPVHNEQIYVDYSMVTLDGVVVTGMVSRTIQYDQNMTFAPEIDYTEDDSCTAFATSNEFVNEYCYVVNQTVDSTRLAKCALYSTQNGKKTFVVVPSLNTDCVVYFVGSSDAQNWGVATINCRINSHLFIWNWTLKGSDHYPDEFSSLLINTDDPPQQTRSYTTDIKFSTPAGRIHPVGFSMSNLSTDLSITGVVVDDDANYVAAGPLPNHSSISHLRRLIMLSGYGVHPVYRTPYGDFYTVGIESIDLSKTKLGLSTATVKQRAVKD